MKRYPAWQAVFRSFYSLAFYRDVAQNWSEFGFVHLWLLAGFNWLVLAITLHFMINSFCDKYVTPLVDQLPTITSTNGKFSIDKPSPYYIRDVSSGKPVITFDMSGKPEANYSSRYLITENSILMHTGTEDTTQTYKEVMNPSQAGPGVFTGQSIRDSVTLLRTCGAAIVFVLGWMLGTIFLFVQALFYAVGGLIFSAISGTKLSYPQLVRLSAIAITPPALIDTVARSVTPWFVYYSNLPLFMVVGLGISMIYLIVAIVSCKRLFAAPFGTAFDTSPLDAYDEPPPPEALDEPSDPGAIPPDTPLA